VLEDLRNGIGDNLGESLVVADEREDLVLHSEIERVESALMDPHLLAMRVLISLGISRSMLTEDLS
jgi:hypothetical protein